MDERSLEVSIDGRQDSACSSTRTATRTHRCVVYDDSGGGASYAMTHRNRSCWEARLIENTSYEVEPPLTLSSCVRLWQWSILDLLI